MDAACAADSWVWLYVLLAVVIPTSLGFVMGVVKAALIAADLKERFGWEVPAVFLTLPGPILYITLGILGIILWATMDDSCGKWYEANAGLLFIVFKIQVILLGIASIFGVITCVSQASVLIAEIAGRKVSPSVLRALPKSALASACLAFSCARRPELVSAFACAAPATCLDSL
jgi:hypothetical protein